MRTSLQQCGRKLDKQMTVEVQSSQKLDGFLGFRWNHHCLTNCLWDKETRSPGLPRGRSKATVKLLLNPTQGLQIHWRLDVLHKHCWLWHCVEVLSIDLPSNDLPHWLWCLKQTLCKGDGISQCWDLKPCDPWCVLVRVPCTNGIYEYECGRAMLRLSGVAPAPSGHEWRFQCSVGVDCSDVEPRCIWLAVLRGVSPQASPRRIPIASPRRRGFRRAIQRRRLSWVRGQTVDMGHRYCISFLPNDCMFHGSIEGNPNHPLDQWFNLFSLMYPLWNIFSAKYPLTSAKHFWLKKISNSLRCASVSDLLNTFLNGC